MAKLDDSDIRPGKIRPASDDDFYRPRRGRAVIRPVVAPCEQTARNTTTATTLGRRVIAKLDTTLYVSGRTS